jgi:hypothetical protein
MKSFPIIIIVLVLVAGGVFFFRYKQATAPEIPEVTYTPPSARDMIVVTSPIPGAVIASPVTITGEARGGWYFEATFPIVLVDWDGLIIAEGFATADGEWMTENFVPFSATLSFTKPTYGERGTIILRRSNASGLPEHDAAVDIPILFE